MQCAACGNDNLSGAVFCAQCGSPLSTQATPLPPVASPQAPSTASAAPTPVAAETRVSVASAAIVIFPIALVAGHLFSFVYDPWQVGYPWGGPSDYSLAALVYPWIAPGLGVATSLGLSSRLRLVGRLPAALGIILFVMGLIWTFAGGLILTYVFHFSSKLIYLGLALLAYGVVGLGVGLLFPLVFWRFTKKTSSRLKVAMPMAIAAIAGIGAHFWLASPYYLPNPIRLAGENSPIALAALFGLVICLPAVLISPIVRKA